MKMKKAILSCLMLMGVLSVSAQEQKGTTEYVFEPHWYLQLQGGAQYTTGRELSAISSQRVLVLVWLLTLGRAKQVGEMMQVSHLRISNSAMLLLLSI